MTANRANLEDGIGITLHLVDTGYETRQAGSPDRGTPELPAHLSRPCRRHVRVGVLSRSSKPRRAAGNIGRFFRGFRGSRFSPDIGGRRVARVRWVGGGRLRRIPQRTKLTPSISLKLSPHSFQDSPKSRRDEQFSSRVTTKSRSTPRPARAVALRPPPHRNRGGFFPAAGGRGRPPVQSEGTRPSGREEHRSCK